MSIVENSSSLMAIAKLRQLAEAQLNAKTVKQPIVRNAENTRLLKHLPAD